MNIALIGYRCSGKTAVGNILAQRLGRDFLDTDRLIEQEAGSSIQSLVRVRGWDYFRELEKSVIEKVAARDNLVIGTGGGVVTDEQNVKNLKRNGWVVWLKADAATIKDRMRKEQQSGKIRPSLTGSDPLEEIGHVLNSRAPLYENAADLVVDTAARSPRDVADLVMKGLSLKSKKKDA